MLSRHRRDHRKLLSCPPSLRFAGRVCGTSWSKPAVEHQIRPSKCRTTGLQKLPAHAGLGAGADGGPIACCGRAVIGCAHGPGLLCHLDGNFATALDSESSARKVTKFSWRPHPFCLDVDTIAQNGQMYPVQGCNLVTEPTFIRWGGSGFGLPSSRRS